jgi:predicted alpha/beta-fold hydrolase
MNPAQSNGLSLPFSPLPLLGNPHVQTLLGHFLPAPAVPFATTPHILPLPDGDALVLHDTVPPGWGPGDPVGILVHGLTGSHASRVIRRLARLLLTRRVRVVRLDLRGAGRGLLLAQRGYHAGCSADVRRAVEEVHRGCPASPVWLAGVSLGGNVVLKLAGEAADAPVPGLARVAALNPPIDLEECSNLLARRANRIYEGAFVRGLVAEVTRRMRLLPDTLQVRFPRKLTIRAFDDLYTAPCWGFASAGDYYRRSSALPWVPRIRLPALVLTARDDPFVAVGPFEGLACPENVAVHIAPGGGHVGFLGRDGTGGFRWAERVLVDWLLRKDEG